MKREVQIDLFKEFEQKIKKKSRYPLLRRVFPYEFINLKISYEGIIFFFIIFVLLSVIIFSLGVERGKRLAFSKKDLWKENLELNKQEYTIQVGVFRDRKLAIEFIKELMNEGYKPFIIYSKDLYQICIGKYPNRELAKEELYKLAKKYKQSYIRIIPQIRKEEEK